MKPLGLFVVGAVTGPVLILAIGYGIAFPGWALTTLGIILLPFVGAFLLGMMRAIPTAEQRAAAAAEEERRRFDDVRRGYRSEGRIDVPDPWRPLLNYRDPQAAPAYDRDEPVPTGGPRSRPADLKLTRPRPPG